MKPPLNRRRFLQGAGVALALPLFDGRAMGRAAEAPRRMVAVCTTLGLYSPNFHPKEAGADYVAPPYLEILKDLRKDFTVCSGLSHADQAGADGHTSGLTWLTAAKHPGLGGFKNTVSLDQYLLGKLTPDTRFPSLSLTTGGTGLSWSPAGIAIPCDESPSKIFAKLFLDGTASEIQTQVRRLKDGRSILDDLAGDTRKLNQGLGERDREKLEEYTNGVRELERRLHAAEAWSTKPKPKVAVAAPKDIANRADIVGRSRLLYDLVYLALQTDSTRIITLMLHGTNSVPPIEGVTDDHHNLSHHGQDNGKIGQLSIIEKAEMTAFAEMLAKLKGTKEDGGTLLDRTTVLFGSNLGNASSHDTRNLPILLAGGGFKHGRHLAFDPKNPPPLCNLFVSMLQRMGVETDRFAYGTKTLTGLELA